MRFRCFCRPFLPSLPFPCGVQCFSRRKRALEAGRILLDAALWSPICYCYRAASRCHKTNVTYLVKYCACLVRSEVEVPRHLLGASLSRLRGTSAWRCREVGVFEGKETNLSELHRSSVSLPCYAAVACLSSVLYFIVVKMKEWKVRCMYSGSKGGRSSSGAIDDYSLTSPTADIIQTDGALSLRIDGREDQEESGRGAEVTVLGHISAHIIDRSIRILLTVRRGSQSTPGV